MKIIVINGQGGAGKDTFVEKCQEVNPNVVNLSMVGAIRFMVKELGWDGVKDERGRRFLSDIKDALARYNDQPFQLVLKQVRMVTEQKPNTIFFIHAREPEDIDRWVKDHGAKTLLITRPDVKGDWDNHADANVYNYDYDYHYSNDDGIGRLTEDAEKFIKFIDRLEWESHI